MAIVPVHEAITRDALKEFGFVSQAIEVVAEANAAVDKKQGDDASETNLHSMRGYSWDSDPVLRGLNVRPSAPQPTSLSMRSSKSAPPGVAGTQSPPSGIKLGRLNLFPDPLSSTSMTYRLQTEDQAKQAVKALLDKAKSDVIDAVLRKDYDRGLRRLGEALHTVQDRVFHHFESWPYRDIPDALMKSPNYMMCHALRDVGYLSKVGIEEHQFALGVATRVEPQLYMGVDTFGPIGSQATMTEGFRGWGGMITLTFGAAPGSIRSPGKSAPSGGSGPDEAVVSCLATEGVADKAKATDDSKQFIKEIREEIESAPQGGQIWDSFLHKEGP